ncbi:MAG: hypothetical protein ACI8W3_001394 [Myxococcota bacterium]|jgi:hypothetical protein
MNRRISTPLCASLGIFALSLAIGCGKYGRPERISYEPKAAAASDAVAIISEPVSEPGAELDSDEEPKRDKPNKP